MNKRFVGYLIGAGEERAHSATWCAINFCKKVPSCVSINFNRVTKLCELNREKVNGIEKDLTQYQNWEYHETLN